MCAAAPNLIPETTRVSRMQVWGGNCNAERSVHAQGFVGWVFCRAFPPSSCGGDVYYLSACAEENLHRIVLADVSGHGGEFNAAANQLANLIADHINTHDQSELMRQLNRDVLQAHGKYATAVVLSYLHSSGTMLFTTAGHPPVLWYRAADRSWTMLHEDTEHAVGHEGLPIGLIPDTDYSQTMVQTGPGDVFVLYTDGFAEACDPKGNELGYEGLMNLAAKLSCEAPETFGSRLLDAVGEFCGSNEFDDDRTLVVLQRV